MEARRDNFEIKIACILNWLVFKLCFFLNITKPLYNVHFLVWSHYGTDFYIGFTTLAYNQFVNALHHPRILVTTEFARNVSFKISNSNEIMFSGQINAYTSVTYVVP